MSAQQPLRDMRQEVVAEARRLSEFYTRVADGLSKEKEEVPYSLVGEILDDYQNEDQIELSSSLWLFGELWFRVRKREPEANT